MKSNVYHDNIIQETLENKYFRRIGYTDHNTQLSFMNIKPKDSTGFEVHTVTQQIQIVKGIGLLKFDQISYALTPGSLVIVPAGTRHEIINISPKEQLKLFTFYSPSEHLINLIQEKNPRH